MIPKSELESKPGLLELESGSRDAGPGIRIGIKVFLGKTGIRIRIESLATGIGMGIAIIDFGKPLNLNRNQPYWNRSLNLNQKKKINSEMGLV